MGTFSVTFTRIHGTTLQQRFSSRGYIFVLSLLLKIDRPTSFGYKVSVTFATYHFTPQDNR
jgi:hypothetical protein